jgi:hypothetical protein
MKKETTLYTFPSFPFLQYRRENREKHENNVEKFIVTIVTTRFRTPHTL